MQYLFKHYYAGVKTFLKIKNNVERKYGGGHNSQILIKMIGVETI